MQALTRKVLWTPGPPVYKAKPEILLREWCTTAVTNTVIVHVPSPAFWQRSGSERQAEAPNGVFEASWPLLGGFGQAFGGFGQAFGESWAALWGAFGAS